MVRGRRRGSKVSGSPRQEAGQRRLLCFILRVANITGEPGSGGVVGRGRQMEGRRGEGLLRSPSWR